ncbi:calcium-binding protein [Anatilimnocola floriformis]|uniref:calcium-binding protein n=1 Tax=Anatilimnocola floriformis TaxID=2948575 RepID=UPI0020C1C73C|nr:calcium-binding protein [Anatilimnocola floriformis]
MKIRKSPVKPVFSRPRVEQLESRDLLANLVWANRGQASDRFAEVFGANAEGARRVVDAVLASWATVLVNLNQPPVDAPADRNTISFNISMSQTDPDFGGAAAITRYAFPTEADKAANRNGHPIAGDFTLNRGTVGQPNNGWWIDPTPNESSEFTNILSPFAASRPDDAVGVDLYGTINAEFAHILGLYDTAPARLPTPLTGTVTKTTIPDQAHGGGVGFYYVFDGPSGTHLLTSWDSGGGPRGQDVNGPTHTAGPTAANYPVAFTSQYRGAVSLRGGMDPGNASLSAGARVLASDNVAQVLKDAYGYEIRLPSTIPGGTFNVGVAANTLNVRGGPDGDGPAAAAANAAGAVGNPNLRNDNIIAAYRDNGGVSADSITLKRDGNDVVVTYDLGRDGPVGGLDSDGDGNAPPFVTRVPLSSFTSIKLDSDGGNDTITLDFSGGDFLPAGGLRFDGDLGVDKLIVTGATTYRVDGDVLTLTGLGTVALDSVAELQLVGTAAADTFEVRNWAGAITLDGQGGNDSYTIDWSAGAKGTARIVDNGGTADQVQVIGTAGADAILVTGSVLRSLAAVVDFRNTGIEQLTVDGGAGSDTILVLGSPVGTFVRLLGGQGNDVLQGSDGSEFISGGDGNDIITTGQGDDLVLGGAGNDVITTLPGISRSLVIGGLGSDTITAGGTGTLLIGGTTNYDNNEAALRSLLAVWARRDLSYALRLAQLRVGGGANGANVLTAATVKEDNARDILFGSVGQDWYWATGLDLVVGKAANELVN